MGANAQTAVPTFTASQVLTASQQNQINTGIPVFATTTTRDAAFGGTNKTLAQGQMAFIEATNTTQYYNGSAWVTLNGGLTLIESNSFSAVSSVSASANVFSSTYNFYRVVFHLTACSANMEVYLRMRAAGTDYSGTNYFYSGAGYVATSGTSGFSTGSATYQFTGYVTAASTDLFAYSGDIYNPNVATYTNIVGQSFTSNSAYSGSVGSIQSAGVVRQTTQYDSFSFVASTGNFTGRYAIYGYNK